MVYLTPFGELTIRKVSMRDIECAKCTGGVRTRGCEVQNARMKRLCRMQRNKTNVETQRCKTNGLMDPNGSESRHGSEIGIFQSPPPFIAFFEATKRNNIVSELREGGWGKTNFCMPNEYPLEPKCIS